jgi:hypothetical protein
MPSELKPTTAAERLHWKAQVNLNGSLGKPYVDRLLADHDRLSAIIVAMHQCAQGDNISGVLCEAQDYFETYGGDDADED